MVVARDFAWQRSSASRGRCCISADSLIGPFWLDAPGADEKAALDHNKPDSGKTVLAGPGAKAKDLGFLQPTAQLPRIESGFTGSP
jgi:hypothetical protein